jgi:hypothetical protein
MPSGYGAKRWDTTALILTTASPAWATDQYLKANVNGTVQTQAILSPGDGRVRTAPLNNKRIFQEFQVSPLDYELVYDIISSGGLMLLPKSAAAMLPSLTVVQLGQHSENIFNTKARCARVESDLAVSSATNLFKNLDGELVGTAFFKGPLAPPIITKFNFTVTARGSDNSGGGCQPSSNSKSQPKAVSCRSRKRNRMSPSPPGGPGRACRWV